MRLKRGPLRAKHLQQSLAGEAPTAVRHAAARQAFVDQLYRGKSERDLLSALRDRFPDEIDNELHMAARRSAEGFALLKLKGFN
jgi:hypothetical protein